MQGQRIILCGTVKVSRDVGGCKVGSIRVEEGLEAVSDLLLDVNGLVGEVLNDRKCVNLSLISSKVSMRSATFCPTVSSLHLL